MPKYGIDKKQMRSKLPEVGDAITVKIDGVPKWCEVVHVSQKGWYVVQFRGSGLRETLYAVNGRMYERA